MNCRECGAEINEKAKFCRHCGETVIISEEAVENTSFTESKQSDDIERLKNYGQEFLQYIINVLKKPVLGKQNLRNALSQKRVLIFLPIMILINSIIVSFQFKTLQNSIMKINMGYWSLEDILGNFLYIESKDLVINQFIFTSVFLGMLGLGIFLVYQILLKMDINFIDTLRIALHAIIVLSISNGIAWMLGIISLPLLAVTIIVNLLLFTVMVFAQVFACIGSRAKVIYTIPGIYLVSLYLALRISIKLI